MENLLHLLNYTDIFRDNLIEYMQKCSTLLIYFIQCNTYFQKYIKTHEIFDTDAL